MDIKIPSGPQGGGVIDAAKDGAETAAEPIDSADSPAIDAEAQDAISTVAEQVARGEINRPEAIEKILGEILDSTMVEAAPEGLKQELGDALKSLLDTDPYLRSLAAAIGPSKNE